MRLDGAPEQGRELKDPGLALQSDHGTGIAGGRLAAEFHKSLCAILQLHDDLDVVVFETAIRTGLVAYSNPGLHGRLGQPAQGFFHRRVVDAALRTRRNGPVMVTISDD